MSFVWFNQVLAALGKRLNYESISNLYGNSFAKDSSDIISRANPLVHAAKKGSISDFTSQFKIVNKKEAESNVSKEAKEINRFKDLFATKAVDLTVNASDVFNITNEVNNDNE